MSAVLTGVVVTVLAIVGAANAFAVIMFAATLTTLSKEARERAAEKEAREARARHAAKGESW